MSHLVFLEKENFFNWEILKKVNNSKNRQSTNISKDSKYFYTFYHV